MDKIDEMVLLTVGNADDSNDDAFYIVCEQEPGYDALELYLAETADEVALYLHCNPCIIHGVVKVYDGLSYPGTVREWHNRIYRLAKQALLDCGLAKYVKAKSGNDLLIFTGNYII